MAEKKLVLARTRGFCSVVRATLATLEKLLSAHPGEPVCVLRELVHNRHVTAAFERRGVRFLNDLSELPPGAILLIGAHGVPPETERRAKELAKLVVDTTCPMVGARYREAAKLVDGDTLMLLGHPGHPETVGIVGWSGAGTNVVISSAAEAETVEASGRPVLLTQTTFDAFELERCRKILERRFPDLAFRGGVCAASRERQACVEKLAQGVEFVVVAGSPHSSNARRLCETAERCGARCILAESAAELPSELFSVRRVGLTAGASTPDEDVDEMLKAFAAAGFAVEEQTAEILVKR